MLLFQSKPERKDGTDWPGVLSHAEMIVKTSLYGSLGMFTITLILNSDSGVVHS